MKKLVVIFMSLLFLSNFSLLFARRMFNPQLARWMQVDPADEFHSPYVYCGNNPINCVDPDGSETLYSSDIFSKMERVFSASQNNEALDQVQELKQKFIEADTPNVNCVGNSQIAKLSNSAVSEIYNLFESGKVYFGKRTYPKDHPYGDDEVLINNDLNYLGRVKGASFLVAGKALIEAGIAVTAVANGLDESDLLNLILQDIIQKPLNEETTGDIIFNDLYSPEN